MKTFTASRFLTLASICLYSLVGFASLADDQNAALTKEVKRLNDASEKNQKADSALMILS